MQNYKTITTSLNAAGVAELVLNRAEVHNAFDDNMIGELINALKAWLRTLQCGYCCSNPWVKTSVQVQI